jgi:oxygen-independent coproporphyrinogen-3 oxidase
VEGSNSTGPGHIGFYIHIPFCRKICYYCGCNSCRLKEDLQVRNYISALREEIRRVTKLIDKGRKISQIHYGGGTPNAIDAGYLEEISGILAGEFSFIESPEIAIECNPAYLDYRYIDRLVNSGFNRFSLGIQDFNPAVLKSANRSPSAIPVEELVDYLHRPDPPLSVNLDFIYGLPGQNVGSFTDTISRAIQISPDRLVTFSYAHVPWLKKHQRILEKKGIPSPDEKISLFLASRSILLEAGYLPVGLDHYVLPGDELGLALRDHQLHRNFQGYCTRRTTGQVYAFGVTAISQMEKGYVQNIKDVDQYIEVIGKGKLAVEKGYLLSDPQIIIRDVITTLMCNLHVNLKLLAGKYSITLNELQGITGFDEMKLSGLISDGLVEYSDHELNVTETGSLFIRNIASIFDPGYSPQSNRYSRSV